jgi:hypothetical protein
MRQRETTINSARADLLATLDELRRQVKRGEVECIAIVAITPETFLPPIFVGEAQSIAAMLGAASMLTAHVNELVADAFEDDCDDEVSIELDTRGTGDERAN